MHTNGTEWRPTPLEVSIAQIVVLKDTLPLKNDVLFVHAPASDSALDKKLLSTALDAYKNKRVKKIIINGISKKDCVERNSAYLGYEKWLKYFLQEGIPQKDIIVTPPTFHTAAETIYLLSLAKKNKWKKIIITSHPHHQLRCFLQAVAIMQEMNFWPKIYNLTHDGISWNQNLKKTILDGKEPAVEGNLKIHIISEFERIIKYAQYKSNAAYIRHATIPEMFKYLDLRK